MIRRNRHRASGTLERASSKSGIGARGRHPQPFLQRVLKSPASKCLLATLAFTFLFLWLTKAWRLSLYNPITYWGDALEMASYLGRDYVFNDLHERFFAPFGIDHASPIRYVLNFFFQPNSTLFLLSYLVTRTAIASLNLYYLLTFPLVFVSAYWVYGRFRLAEPFRFGAATLYALMPFHFQRGEGHLMESSYFVVPLLSYIVIGLFRSRPYFHAYVRGAWRFSWTRGSDWLVLAVIVFLSSLSEYHQFFFLMLFALAALASSFQHRSLRILLGATVMLGAAGLSVFLKVRLAGMISEPGLGLSLIGAPIANYGDAERYGLKMIQIILPVHNHPLEFCRHITQTYNASHEANENSTAALGLFGAVGFIYLLVRGGYGIIRRKSKSAILDRCAFLNLCCIAIATIGGAASVIATASVLVFGPDSLLTQVRCYNRISVFIGFFSYYAGAFLLMRLMRTASALVSPRWSNKALLVGACVPIFALAIWDQVPFEITNSIDGTVRYRSDRQFFNRIEAQLAPRSLIFQYPYNIHHANVSGPAVPPYNYCDGIRPYLNSRTLRFTYGGDNGSAQARWLQETAALPPPAMLHRLCEYGFSGIVVHRRLFQDANARVDFEAQLTTSLGLTPQESQDGDFSFTPLEGFCAKNQIAKLDPAARIALWQDRTGLDVIPGPETSHTTGKFDSTTKTMVGGKGASGWLMFGPYTRLDRGRYKATFTIAAEADVPGVEVGTVDVNGFLGNIPKPPLASASLRAAADEQTINLTFEATNPQTLYEFRVFVTGAANRVTIRQVQIRKL